MKKKIIKKITLGDLKKIILRETRRVLSERRNEKLDIFIGSFYCEELSNNTESDVEKVNVYEGRGNIGFYQVKKRKYDVYVYNRDEGFKPHMHILSEGFESCVEIEKAEYFLHKRGQKPMTNKVVDKLDEFMRDINKASLKIGRFSNYEAAVFAWDSNDNRNEVKVTKDNDGNIVIPNYKLLRV